MLRKLVYWLYNRAESLVLWIERDYRNAQAEAEYQDYCLRHGLDPDEVPF